MIQHDSVRSLLSRSPDLMHSGPELEVEAGREVSWLRRTSGGGLQEGVLDRIVVAGRDGLPEEALVIDWKTDRVPPGDEIAQAESYRSQLEAYREAAVSLTGLRPDQVGAVVAFVRSGILIPIES